MKKIITFILILLFIFTLSACGKNETLEMSGDVQSVKITKKQKFGDETFEFSIKLENDVLDEFKAIYNSIEFVATKQKYNGEYKFIIEFDDTIINVISNEYFYIKNDNLVYNTKNTSFMFLYDYDFLSEHLVDLNFSDVKEVYYVVNGELELNISINDNFKKKLSEFRAMETNYTENEIILATFKIDGRIVNVIEHNIIEIDKVYYLLDRDITYDIINKEGLTQLTDLELAEYIKVIRAEDSKSVDINNREEFIRRFNELRFIELNHKRDYDTNDAKYGVEIGKYQIIVYNEYLINFNSTLYYVTEGDLTFLDQINFDSTGWLPWV